MHSQLLKLLATLNSVLLLARTSLAECACGYSVNSRSSFPNALFTDLLETDFLHLLNVSSDAGWQPQAYNVSAADARGPYGKDASLANIVANPILNPFNWGGPGVNGGDPGLQLWVRAPTENGLIGMAELLTERRNMIYGSMRVGMKLPNVAGTCGAFFFYYNNTQEIDMEFLSKDFTANNNSINLVIQTPASAAAGFNAAGTPDYQVIKLPFAPDDAYHEYRFDWLPDHVSFYADSVWLVDMNISIPNTAGGLYLNHWSNGDLNWTSGPPTTDAVMTVSYVKAYFNTSDANRNNQYTQACGSGGGNTSAEICQIPDQTVAPDPDGVNGNSTGHTFFFTEQQNMTVNQTTYPSAPGVPDAKKGESMGGVETSKLALASALLIFLVAALLI